MFSVALSVADRQRNAFSAGAQVLPGSAPNGARTFLDARSLKTRIATTRLAFLLKVNGALPKTGESHRQ